jgi:hypothetical protein
VDELAGLQLPNLHICVTSRPEMDIRTVLRPLCSHPISLHDESGQKQDIVDYVRSVVHSDKRMRRWREEDKDLVVETLAEKADGMCVRHRMLVMDSYEITQVPMGVLSTRNLTPVLPTECAAYPRGTARKSGRDV